MAWTLCSREDVQSIHPTPADDLRDEWSDMVEGLIRQHLNEPHLGSPVAITGERHDGDGTHILHVKKPPILSVEALYVNGGRLSAGDFVAFESYVELKAGKFAAAPLNVKIDYTSGSNDVPETVRLAAAAMIVAIINYKRRAGADGSYKWGAPDKQVGTDTPNQNVGLTSHMATIMKRILRRNTVRVR